MVRVYLDQLPAAAPDNFEMGVLEMIAASPETAMAKARALVPRLRSSNRPRVSVAEGLKKLGESLRGG